MIHNHENGDGMQRKYAWLVIALFFCSIFSAVSNSAAREFLTDEEIKKIQEAQEINRRIKIYMDAAEYRLKTAEERLLGEEPVEGDPLEFSAPEDLVDGYYQILRSVMLNLDGAYQEPGTDLYKVKEGLKTLEKATENTSKQLKILRRIAEDKKKEELWNLVNKAIDITDGAHEGAVYGLEKLAEMLDRKQRRR
jgi:hypothetical protein